MVDNQFIEFCRPIEIMKKRNEYLLNRHTASNALVETLLYRSIRMIILADESIKFGKAMAMSLTATPG